MITLSFRIPRLFSRGMVFSQAYFATWGRIPCSSVVHQIGDRLIVEHETDESGTLHIPIAHKRLGVLIHTTDTLIQREKSYHLLKELARGELGRLQRRLFEWNMIGFELSDPLRQEMKRILGKFSIMVTSDERLQTTDALAAELLLTISKLGIKLANRFADQTIRARLKNRGQISMPLGVFANMGANIDSYWNSKPLTSLMENTFQIIASAPSWRELEPEPGQYCWSLLDNRLSQVERLGMKNMLGPIFSFEQSRMPDWILRRLHDGDILERSVLKYARTLTQLFRDRCSHWLISSRFFSCPENGLSMGRGIALINNVAKELKRLGVQGPTIVGVDQPWGDYYRTTKCSFPFIGVIDALSMCSSIDAFMLELNLGLSSRSSLPRDPMLLGRLVDHWASLGKTIYVALSVPSETEVFSHDILLEMDEDHESGEPAWDVKEDTSGSSSDTSFQWTPQFQQEWINRSMYQFLTKRNIQGFFWNQLIDPAVVSEEDSLSFMSSSGLIDSQGSMKPAFRKLYALRKAYLS
ncbi:MAG: hypothetical protein ACRC10_02600 [Thermoguttaceae bacterium]